MNFWRSLNGIWIVELTSAEPEAALAAINSAGIDILQMKKAGDLIFQFAIARTDRGKLEILAEKRGEHLQFTEKKGIFWTFKSLLTRPVILFGCFLLVFAVFYLPSRILFVRVEGNQTIPQRQILDAAEMCGIKFGASRREVRSEKVKNDLLGILDRLQWAGVNTSGCVATISVKERGEAEAQEEEISFSNITALRDGYVLSGTATKGTPLFEIGQTVHEGQVLISGYTDCGLCIQATRAEGEVYAQTKHDFKAVTPAECVQHSQVTAVKRKISLIIRKKRIILWKDSGISEGNCGRMYKEYYATLPGDFQLPVGLCIETYQFCNARDAWISQEVAEESLRQFADSYVMQQMIAGQIQERNENIFQDNGVYCFQGIYTCTEMIGREQIGDIYGKDG